MDSIMYSDREWNLEVIKSLKTKNLLNATHSRGCGAAGGRGHNILLENRNINIIHTTTSSSLAGVWSCIRFQRVEGGSNVKQQDWSFSLSTCWWRGSWGPVAAGRAARRGSSAPPSAWSSASWRRQAPAAPGDRRQSSVDICRYCRYFVDSLLIVRLTNTDHNLYCL